MATVDIIFDSQTGFTERMAKAVAEGVDGVEDVEVAVFKVGTPFSVSKLNAADAIILGSPTIYGSVTPAMNIFLECVKAHVESKRLNLSGKIGGVFASYEWDGGWVADKLCADLKALGVKVVAPAVSLVDGMGGSYEIRVRDDDLQKCRKLGQVIAETINTT